MAHWSRRDAHLIEVAENVYAYLQPDGTWWINNTGLVVGTGEAVSIDSCSTEARTRAYLEAIAAVTPHPVTKLVNTHHHGDHTFGNWLFADAVVIGHEAVRDGITAWGPPRSEPFWTQVDWGNFAPAPPTLTYTDEVTLWCGDQRLAVRHVGEPAHTAGDSIIWLAEQQVLFVGDLLFNGGTPFVVQGSIAGLLRVIDNVLRPLPARVIVCGHGPLAESSLLDETAGYLRFIQERAAVGHAAGASPLEVARETNLGIYGAWSDPERLVGNLHRAYYELEPHPDHAFDAMAALADMVTLNGGHPLVSHA